MLTILASTWCSGGVTTEVRARDQGPKDGGCRTPRARCTAATHAHAHTYASGTPGGVPTGAAEQPPAVGFVRPRNALPMPQDICTVPRRPGSVALHAPGHRAHCLLSSRTRRSTPAPIPPCNLKQLRLKALAPIAQALRDAGPSGAGHQRREQAATLLSCAPTGSLLAPAGG